MFRFANIAANASFVAAVATAHHITYIDIAASAIAIAAIADLVHSFFTEHRKWKGKSKGPAA